MNVIETCTDIQECMRVEKIQLEILDDEHIDAIKLHNV